MTGAYDLEGVIWHQHSNKLMVQIMKLWPDKKKPVRDLGCGHNFYMTVLNYAGYEDATGYDMVDLGSRFFQKKDVSDVYEFQIKDVQTNVLSLEVGEHIPFQKSLEYLTNVIRVANGGDVILSWAIPGQSGYGHVNCKSNAWVLTEMKLRGYSFDAEKTLDLRLAVQKCHCSWFRDTLMYFYKETE